MWLWLDYRLLAMTTKYIHCKSQEHFAYRKMSTMHTECIFHTPISVLRTVKIYLRTHTQCSIIYLCCFPRLGMYWCAQTCKVILENQNIIRDLGYNSVLKPVRLYLRTHTYMKMYLSIFLADNFEMIFRKEITMFHRLVKVDNET